MQLNQILASACTFCNLPISSKKRALEVISEHIANCYSELNKNSVFKSLMGREQIGSTSLGHGIALPHARMPHLSTPIGCLVTLENGIDFDAFDDIPVDLLFVLLVPEEATEEHLTLLAKLAELFEQTEARKTLRACQSDNELYHEFVNYGK